MKKGADPDDNLMGTLKNQSSKATLPHVNINILGYRSDDVQDLDGWMKYYQYRSLKGNVPDYFTEPAQIILHATYKQDRLSKELPRFIISMLRMFATWIADKFIAKGGELTHWNLLNLNNQDFNCYCIQVVLVNPRCNTLLTATPTPETGIIMLSLQQELAIFKQGRKEMTWHI